MDSDRMQVLEEARGLSLDGHYEEALLMVDRLLQLAADDVDGLRLKGNILELQALDRHEYSTKKLMSSAEYLEARLCYERILALDPGNSMALMDLGDHYKNLSAFDRALEYYAQVVAALANKHDSESRDQAEDLLRAVREVLVSSPESARAATLELECRQLTKSIQ
jgi:tetratricopeptide (TPR) repeat protein